MKPRMQLSPKTKVKTKVSRQLIYGATGLAILGLLIAGWFLYFQLGDSETSRAGTAVNAPANDLRNDAVWLKDLYEHDSEPGAYTNTGATSDVGGACFTGGAQQGVWFKFKALYPDATITIKTGGSEGTAQHLEVAVEEASGTAVACSTAAGASSDVTLSLSGLTVDNWYYILVDTRNPADEGTFTTYINNVSPVKYYSRDKGDWDKDKTWSTSGYNGPKAGSTPGKANVVFIKDVDGEIKVKGDEECAALIMESDNKESELRIEPNEKLSVYGRFEIKNYNHKSVKFEMKSGGDLYVQADWNIQKLNGWENLDIKLDGDSVRVDGNLFVHHSNGEGIKFELKSGSLTVEEDIEFIQSGGYNGNDYKLEENVYAGGDLIINKTNGSGDRKIEFKKNKTYTVLGSLLAEKTGGSGKEEIKFDDGTLSVSGDMEMLFSGGSGDYEVEIKKMDVSVGGHAYFDKNDGTNKYKLEIKEHTTINANGDMTFRLQQGSADYEAKIEKHTDISVGGNFNMEKNGGTNKFKFEAKDHVALNIAGNSTLLHSGGSAGMELDFDNNVTLASSGNMNMEWTGGSNPFDFTFGSGGSSNNDTLSIGGYFYFGATTGWSGTYRLDAEINRSAITFVGGDIQAIHNHGRLNFKNDDSELVLNGSVQQQVEGESTGSLFIDYRYLEVNNSYTHPDSSLAFGIELMGAVELESDLVLTNGTIRTTPVNLLTVWNTGNVVGGSVNAFVDGPLQIEGNNSLFFPVGHHNIYGPIEIHNQSPNSNSNAYKATYFFETYPDQTTANNLEHVSSVEYWKLLRTAGTADVEYELYWFDNQRSGISDLSDLTIGLYDSTSNQWENVGAVTTTGTLQSGSIRSSSRQGQFGPATFGSVGGGNILPIELAYFTATLNDRGTVDLEWATYVEINNDYFTIERSTDGQNFVPIGEVAGAGNSDQQQDYYFEDASPKAGTNYYRLKQTDFNGASEYFDIQTVKVPLTATSASQLQIMEAAPNPVQTYTNLTVEAPADGPVQLMVTNMQGQTIHSEVRELQQGINRIRLNTADWHQGSYIVNVVQDNVPSPGFRLVKVE